MSRAFLDQSPWSTKQLSFLKRWCVGLPKLQAPCQSTHHLLLLSLPLLLNLLSEFVQLSLSGKQRLKKNTHTHTKIRRSTCLKVCSLLLTEFHFRNISCVYLYEFVVLEYCCGVEDQLAVFNVIFESSHKGFTEGHKFLKRARSGRHINHWRLKCSRNGNHLDSPVDLQVSLQILLFLHSSLHTQHL